MIIFNYSGEIYLNHFELFAKKFDQKAES